MSMNQRRIEALVARTYKPHVYLYREFHEVEWLVYDHPNYCRGDDVDAAIDFCFDLDERTIREGQYHG